MKLYDFEKAKQIIGEKSDAIVSASLGMQEDWFWTAEEVFNKEDGFLIDLDEVTKIAGIDGSDWATPVIRLYFKGDTEKVFNCYTGGNTGNIGMSALCTSGPLSRPVQANIPEAEEYKK
ncbi:hypothetical protein KO561_13030 [Radiobacillus kanasensis]|uniref:hypothetical protein n=1 Tax=Radiobacillus kanasensis TaxID=2844358 RepID=UPI001E5DB23B|nr:hypothetical protein [Radiobacillus kanasensis]UFT98126.1 hypothetical protein KO561_13030 [Radiobacillus kanasensis]